MHLLDYILPQMAELNRALQTKQLDLALISRLVDATLNSLDDAIRPSANWGFQLQDAREELKAATGIEVTHLNICSLQEEWASLLTSDLSTEWKTYRQLFIKQPKDDISMQLKELLTNDMLIALFPHMLDYSHFYSISRTKVSQT